MNKSRRSCQSLRLILGDQLNPKHRWFAQRSDDVVYVIAESPAELRYTTHHKQKIAAFFLAMTNFANALQQAGHHVLHIPLDDPLYRQNPNMSLAELLLQLAHQWQCERIEYQRPDEYRLFTELRSLRKAYGGELVEWDTDHFLLPFDELDDWLQPAHHNRMEFFYRNMRKRFELLVDSGKPVGGRWNYDVENRQRLTPEALQALPEPVRFNNDIRPIKSRIERFGANTMGHWPSEANTLNWPVSRRQSLRLLKEFCEHRLSRFGCYQDAMTCQADDNYGLYHSRLSFSLNTKMLHPHEVLDAALSAYQADPERISLAQIEGFVRQILGWREYMRAFYWINMPDYRQQNWLEASGDLPDYFWNGESSMACVAHALGLSLNHSYAHHIQRLMVTGNLAVLLGVSPAQVNDWYLGVYIDALEWVQLPNTQGMSQFADGGWVATKPYIASGNYIHRMSDYCKHCRYNVKQATGEGACPFNSLYWHFIHRHQKRLAHNPRMGLMYKSWARKTSAQQQAIVRWADRLIARSDSL